MTPVQGVEALRGPALGFLLAASLWSGWIHDPRNLVAHASWSKHKNPDVSADAEER
jgi:hypothetical protein